MQKKTTCPYCGVGCGVNAMVEQGKVTGIKGDEVHPANAGKLCVKGSSLHEVLGQEGRLLHPQINGQAASWDDALDTVAEGFSRTVSEHGPDSVAFYLSGQILTEDYYVANKLIKGFIGTANVDTNSRLCMASAVVGYKRAFGSDTVPCCYEDLELTDLLVLVGSNAAWNHPILYQRMQKAKKANPAMQVIVVDPRRTATCDIADLHLAIKPGTDSELFTGLLTYLATENALDQHYIDSYTEGFDTALATAQAQFPNLQSVADICDLPLADLKQFYDSFINTRKVITFYSQGVNQSSSGSDNANAIINCHLAAGRIGFEGAGPFSITGQPNAMGGREVGGLANQLAAHMDFNSQDAIDRVARFWNASNMAQKEGLKAVDMFQAIEAGEIKAIWIMGTNPAVSLPDTDQVVRALKACPLVVVSDCIADTDTLRHADVCLPATGWSEKNGTVTNSERRISRQRSLLPPSGEAKHDWWIISEVAKRMGFGTAFNYKHPYQIFAEHAALSGFENNGSRDFNISLFESIDQSTYDALSPVQWPVTADAPYGTARMFTDGHYYTPSGRARFIAVQTTAPKQQPTDALPFILNTGRIRDQWHTMAITGRAARLFQHRAEPFVELCQQDAQRLGIEEGALVKISNPQGEFIGRARALKNEQRPGEVFVPMHWNGVFSAKGRMGVLIEPVTDPYSGQPESKHGRVKLEPMNPQWQGWLMCREPLQKQLPVAYWSRVPKKGATLYYLADSSELGDALAWCREQFGEIDIWLEDKGSQSFRAAGLEGEKLAWTFFVMPYGLIPSTQWLEEMFEKAEISMDERRYLLSVTGCELEDPGELICSCYQVGSHAIEDAISLGCDTVDALGAKLKCGTNCGSCIPELNALLQKQS
jgi:assimilatory nitrate reductase catalytic subunit